MGALPNLQKALLKVQKKVDDTEIIMRKVRETAPESVIKRDKRWYEVNLNMSERYPEPTLLDLENADSIVFDTPARYGNMSAELKLFLDITGPLWASGKLIGKVAAVSCTNSTAHSGKGIYTSVHDDTLITSRYDHSRYSTQHKRDGHGRIILWGYIYCRIYGRTTSIE